MCWAIRKDWITIVLNGMTEEVEDGNCTKQHECPQFPVNQQVADVLTYVRNSFYQ